MRNFANKLWNASRYVMMNLAEDAVNELPALEKLEIADKYGADALRFNLVTGNSPGNDMRFYTERCEAMRNFANKIWNASRFLMMNLSIDK